METLSEINKVGGCGASEVGKLFTKQGLKAKTAQTFAYEKAVELITGFKKDITTAAMQHGIFSEEEAYYTVVKPFYPNARYQSSESIPLKKGVWVTPDVIDDFEGLTIDIKCPYSPFTYWGWRKNTPDTAISQVQMQLIGTKHKKGALCLYLTSTNIDEWGNKIEFEIPIEERHYYIPIEAQPDYQKEILERIDGFFEVRDKIYSHLKKAPQISDMEFFKVCGQKKITRFKDKSNLLTWEGKIIKNGNEFYTIE